MKELSDEMNSSKICPYCSEKIKATAVKCRYCNEWFDSRPSGQGPASGSQSGSSSASNLGPSSGRHPGPPSGSPSGSPPGTPTGPLPSTPSGHTPLTGIHLVNHALGDRYEVLEEIGSGGMATVYKAIQKNLNRPVALKVIHQNLVHDEEFVKRFHREAQVCASLQHPNIVTVYDEGEVSGVHFLAMEYLEGTDLRELLVSRGRLSPEETLRYMLPLAEALDYAHGRGLIHRDIKSSNIFICHAQTSSENTGGYHGGVTRTLDPEPVEESSKRGTPASHSTGTGHRSALRVVLMDFGIAHAAAGTQLTRAGAIIGTPEYMSPEQAAGQKVDHRTDLYSLGVVMYECLSGQVPFKGDSAASIIYRVIHEQVDHTGLDDIPPGLRALLSGLMSKKPSGRLASAGSTVEAILQIQQGKDRQPMPEPEPQPSPRPEPPPPESTPSPSPEPSPSRREKSTNTAALYWVVGIIGLIILVVWISNHQSRQQEAITTPRDLNLEMVAVKGGSFTMGCTSEQGSDCFNDEKPAHRVTLSDYYIGKYPVTQRQWRQVMGSNPSHFSGCDDCPVEQVSWNEVQGFISKLNRLTGKTYSLPTEAQWEFAARGGNKSKGVKYAGSNTIGDVAWYSGNSNSKTHPIGQLQANELGIYDMSGNVWEWCSDWYGSYSSDSKTNPTGPSSGSLRVLRGGCWNFTARYCRVSNRGYGTPDLRYFSFGFRLSRMP